MKLIKTKGRTWNGNGFGTAAAQYECAGFSIWSPGYGEWVAKNETTGERLSFRSLAAVRAHFATVEA